MVAIPRLVVRHDSAGKGGGRTARRRVLDDSGSRPEHPGVVVMPGLGRLAYQALTQRDIVVMQAVVLLLSGLVIVVNFLVDLLQMRLDPRLRATQA